MFMTTLFLLLIFPLSIILTCICVHAILFYEGDFIGCRAIFIICIILFVICMYIF